MRRCQQAVGTAKEYCENCCLDTFIDDMWVIPSQLQTAIRQPVVCIVMESPVIDMSCVINVCLVVCHNNYLQEIEYKKRETKQKK